MTTEIKIGPAAMGVLLGGGSVPYGLDPYNQTVISLTEVALQVLRGAMRRGLTPIEKAQDAGNPIAYVQVLNGEVIAELTEKEFQVEFGPVPWEELERAGIRKVAK